MLSELIMFLKPPKKKFLDFDIHCLVIMLRNSKKNSHTRKFFNQPHVSLCAYEKLGEDLVMHWSKLYKLNINSVRLFNVYGPRVRTSGSYGAVFGVFMAQLVNNKPLTLVGTGNQKRDFTYVSDVVDIIIKLSKRKRFKWTNI